MVPLRYVVILTLLILPLAAGHGGLDHDAGEEHDDTPVPDPDDEDVPQDPWFTPLGDSYWYGRAVDLWASPTTIRGLAAHDGWLVWEADDDIWAMPPRGAAFQVTETPDLREHSPAIHGRHIAYVSQRIGEERIWLHDLDTGTTEALTDGAARVEKPDVRGGWVAWLDHRHGNREVYVHDIANGTTHPVALSDAEKEGVVLLDGHVAWIEEELNQWDVAVAALPNGTARHLSRDRDQETTLQSDGRALYWLTSAAGAHRERLRWDPVTDEVVDLEEPGVRRNPLLLLPHNVSVTYRSEAGPIVFYAMNGTTDRTSFISGRVDASTPVSSGSDIYAVVRNDTHHVVYLLNVHRYAVGEIPRITIERPLEGSVLHEPTSARGLYVHGDAWPAPQRLEYRLGRTDWVPFDASANWSTMVDPADVPEGRVGFTVRAVYEDAPTVSMSILVNVRDFGPEITVDLGSTKVFDLQDFVERNPGFILLVALTILFLVLLAARFLLRRRPRGGYVVEYVRQDG